MKRFHVHIAVDDLQKNIQFYSSLFASEPTVIKEDYAKWTLDDPRVNFAISQRGRTPGVDHLGIQVESTGELDEMNQRLLQADLPSAAQIGGACCYAKSDKYWTVDPQGIAWEAFHTLDSIPVFGADTAEKSQAEGCCVPTTESIKAAAKPSTGCGTSSNCC